MKTQIISLELHDDLVSVRDRMSWAKAPRILLVWPRFERITLRPLDLRILQQHAEYLGADLGLVSRSAAVWRVAKGFGIPVFRTTTKAQRDAWPSRPGATKARRRAPPKSADELAALRASAREDDAGWTAGPVARIGFFLLGVLAVLAVAAVFVPRATIVLAPVTMTQDISLPAETTEAEPSAIVAARLPAQAATVNVSATKSMKISTLASVPVAKATGIAHFQNLTLTPLIIPAGTVIYSVSPNGARYATLQKPDSTGSPMLLWRRRSRRSMPAWQAMPKRIRLRASKEAWRFSRPSRIRKP